MPTRGNSDTDDLLQRAEQGDARASQELLTRYRKRLRQAVAMKINRRLATRIDPSDVVQETLSGAAIRLPEYLRSRPLPFFPWLRQLAFDRLAELNRTHVHAKKRSILREEAKPQPNSPEAAKDSNNRQRSQDFGPSNLLLRREMRARIEAGLGQLSATDQDIIRKRNFEHRSVRECAELLGISEGAIRTRHLRALERLRALLEPGEAEL